MRDISGNELHVGDLVVALISVQSNPKLPPNYGLCHATITAINEKMEIAHIRLLGEPSIARMSDGRVKSEHWLGGHLLVLNKRDE